MEDGPKRPLAPARLEQDVWAIGLSLISLVVFAVLAATGETVLEAYTDFIFVLAVVGILAFASRWQFRVKFPVAPSVPAGAQIDSPRKTVMVQVLYVGAFGALIAVAGPDELKLWAVLAAAAAVVGFGRGRLMASWERRNGVTLFRERRFWAQGAPFFYRGTAEERPETIARLARR